MPEPRRAAVALSIMIVGLTSTIALPPRPLLVWNSSPSLPVGLYRLGFRSNLSRDDIVITQLPRPYRLLAAQRHYLPSNVPLLKRVAAMPGDQVCAIGSYVLVNGRYIASRMARDAMDRPMPWWHGCVRLPSEAVFLMGNHPRSFDGRYFGPTAVREIIGKADPLWIH